MNNDNDKNSSTEFFLKYIKKEKEDDAKHKIENEEKEEKKQSINIFIENIYNPINKALDKIVYSNKALVVLSIILTLVLYITMSGGNLVSQTTSGTTIKNVAVSVEGLKDNYEVSGIPDSVTIGLIGPSVDIYTTQLNKDYSVYVDLSEYKVGTHTVNIRTRNFNSDLTVMVLPETTTVKISPKVNRTFTLGYHFKNESKLNVKYAVSLTSLSRKTVNISASEDTLNTIDHVSAVIDVANKTKSFTTKAPVRAYNANGKEVSCTISPDTVEANCRVDSYSKEVVVQPQFTGALASGYTLKSYKLTPTTVTIYGRRSDISDINTVTCNVDISNLSGSTTLTGLKLNANDKITKYSTDDIDIVLTIEKENNNG